MFPGCQAAEPEFRTHCLSGNSLNLLNLSLGTLRQSEAVSPPQSPCNHHYCHHSQMQKALSLLNTWLQKSLYHNHRWSFNCFSYRQMPWVTSTPFLSQGIQHCFQTWRHRQTNLSNRRLQGFVSWEHKLPILHHSASSQDAKQLTEF